MKNFIIGLVIGVILGAILVPKGIFTKQNGEKAVVATQKYGKELGKIFK